jgi:hypothetical protein
MVPALFAEGVAWLSHITRHKTKNNGDDPAIRAAARSSDGDLPQRSEATATTYHKRSAQMLGHAGI